MHPGSRDKAVRGPAVAPSSRRSNALKVFGKKRPRHEGGARLTAWRFPKEGRPAFTQSLLSVASEKFAKNER
jgi:hypothetical protein